MNTLRAIALSLLMLGPVAASAQTPPDNMTRLENAATAVEQSTFNRALPLFGDLYWGFEPAAYQARSPPLSVEEDLRLAFDANVPRFGVYVRRNCGQMTAAQKAFLLAFAQARFDALSARYKERAGEIAQVLGEPDRPIGDVTLSIGSDCARSANAGGREIEISSDLMLTALISAMYVDSAFNIVPDRVVAKIRAALTGSPGDWNDRRGRRVLARLRATPVWANIIRATRVLLRQNDITTEEIEREYLYDPFERENAYCHNHKVECQTTSTISQTITSTITVDMLFSEQVDFIIAHEMGHHALNHVAQSIGSCDAEKAIEAAADRFALALMRPSEGLLGQTDASADLEALRKAGISSRFRSGLDLFMLQSRRLGSLTNGNDCAYPTFEERLATLRAFEARAFPAAAPQH